MKNKWRTKRLLCAIRKADDVQTVQIVRALIQRYQSLEPDTEPVFVLLPRNDPDESRRILDLLYNTIKQKMDSLKCIVPLRTIT